MAVWSGHIRGRVAFAATLLAALALVIPAQARMVGGTSGDDRLEGGPKADTLKAREGDDRLIGKRGRDFLLGGRGLDTLNGGLGFDEIRAGAGNDVIFARDDTADLITCGAGFDVVYVDAIESGIFGCEERHEP